MAERVDRLIEVNLRKSGLWDTAMRHRAVFVWKDAVGERIAANSQAVGILGTSLLVRVENPSWRQQLHLMRLDLMKQVNARLGGAFIEDIRLTARKALITGTIPVRKASNLEWPGQTALKTLVLSQREAREVDQNSERVGDEKLRAVCRKFLITILRRNRLLESLGMGKCQFCGAHTDGTICQVCILEISASRQRRATGILSRLPWLDMEGLRSVDPELGEAEYRVAHDTLASLWTKEALALAATRTKKSIPGLRLLLANLAMLLTHTPPEHLTDTIIVGAAPARLCERAGMSIAQNQ